MELKRKFSEILLNRVSKPCRFINVVVGPRQVGKTTGVNQVCKELEGPIHQASADQLIPPDLNWLQEQWFKARALGPGALLIIDEIQKIPRWSEGVKLLFDEDRNQRDLRVILLGSSTLMLQHGLSESLAGRFELLHVPHWSFREHQEAFGFSLEDFLKFGGYPAIADKEYTTDPDRWQRLIRDSIIEPVLSRDILQQVTVNKPALFKQTFELVTSFPSQVVGLKKMLGQLQEGGNLTTIRGYLELFEKTFLLKLVGKFSGSVIQQRTSSPKIILQAPALAHAFRSPRSVHENTSWKGHIIESVVGSQLSMTQGQLYYWAESDYEVDFVVKLDAQVYAIEVKSGLPRRAKSLGVFLKKYPEAIPLTIHMENLTSFLEQDTDVFLRSHR